MDELHHRTPSQLKGTYFYLTEWNSCSPSVLPYLIPSRLFCVGYRKGWKASKHLQYSIYLTPPPFPSLPWSFLGALKKILVFLKSSEWCWQLLKSWHYWSQASWCNGCSKISFEVFCITELSSVPFMHLSIAEQKSLFNTSPVLALFKQSFISCPATQVRQGRENSADSSKISREIKCRKYFLFNLKKNL